MDTPHCVASLLAVVSCSKKHICQLIFPFQLIAPQAQISLTGLAVLYFPLSTSIVILFASDHLWRHPTDIWNVSRALDMGAVTADLRHTRVRTLLVLCDPLYSAGFCQQILTEELK